MRVAAFSNQEKLISTAGSASGSVNSRYIFCGHATRPDLFHFRIVDLELGKNLVALRIAASAGSR